MPVIQRSYMLVIKHAYMLILY